MGERGGQLPLHSVSYIDTTPLPFFYLIKFEVKILVEQWPLLCLHFLHLFANSHKQMPPTIPATGQCFS